MATYRITCTLQEPCTKPPTEAHIVKVGTGDSTGYSKLWTVAEVIQAMNNADTFYTQGDTSGKVASVHPFQCTECKRWTLRSAPDAVKDNNLDSLPYCRA